MSLIVWDFCTTKFGSFLLSNKRPCWIHVYQNWKAFKRCSIFKQIIEWKEVQNIADALLIIFGESNHMISPYNKILFQMINAKIFNFKNFLKMEKNKNKTLLISISRNMKEGVFFVPCSTRLKIIDSSWDEIWFYGPKTT